MEFEELRVSISQVNHFCELFAAQFAGKSSMEEK